MLAVNLDRKAHPLKVTIVTPIPISATGRNCSKQDRPANETEFKNQHSAQFLSSASIFDFVQGITRVARDKPHQDTRLDMEGRAKKLLDFAG
jgi:hypothetical protein